MEQLPVTLLTFFSRVPSMTLARRKLTDAITLFTGWMRRGRRVKPRLAVVKVNLGCGLTVADGWINVDGSLSALFAHWPSPLLRALYRLSGAREWYSERQYVDILKGHSFVHHNLGYGVPFPDESVDYIFSSHLLQHFLRGHAERLLADAHRVLKRGGQIRLTVPDLEYAVSLYLDGRKEKALGFFFGPSRTGQLSRHLYLYDFEMLKSLLSRVGFVAIERREYQKGQVPDLNKLDVKPDRTLFVEATK